MPKYKVTYIEDGGKTLADTTFIIDYLKQNYGDSLDAGLSPAEKATALAFQRLLEENLYWAVVHTRWVDPAGWAQTKAAFFANFDDGVVVSVDAAAGKITVKKEPGTDQKALDFGEVQK